MYKMNHQMTPRTVSLFRCSIFKFCGGDRSLYIYMYQLLFSTMLIYLCFSCNINLTETNLASLITLATNCLNKKMDNALAQQAMSEDYKQN